MWWARRDDGVSLVKSMVPWCNGNISGSQPEVGGSTPLGTATLDRIEPMNPAYSDIPWFKVYMAYSSSDFRKRLIRKGLLDKKCYECGITEWRGVPAPLQLDHVDGNRANCMLSNLRILCPNCHALTETFSGKNIARRRVTCAELIREYDGHLKRHKKPPTASVLYAATRRYGGLGGSRHATRIQTLLGEGRPLSRANVRSVPSPTKIKWPSDKNLAKLLETKSRVEIGEMLGVSDNAVKKRILTRDIPEPSKMRLRTPKSRKPVVLSPINHGTIKGYRAEIRRGISPCDRCRKANTEHSRQYRQTHVPDKS